MMQHAMQSLIFLNHSLRNLYNAEAPHNIRVKLLVCLDVR